MTSAYVCPAHAVAHLDPGFVDSLSEIERFVLPYVYELWTRPDLIFPDWEWRSLTLIGGRGLGKTTSVGAFMNREIEAGRIKSPALIAPTLDRVDEVQRKMLIETAPPWFKPEKVDDDLVWPNGVIAEAHTPEGRGAGRTRGSTFDFSWLTEVLDWSPNTRHDAFRNITTATRAGRAQYVIDTTSKGTNEIIATQLDLNAGDPRMHVLLRGSTFDNPLLSPKYLRDECAKYEGQRFGEEILGLVYGGTAGALFSQDVIRLHRRPAAPERPALVLVAVDPALSARKDADETGIVKGARGRDGHTYILSDDSGHHEPEAWAKIVVDHCALDAAGIVLERNHAGDLALAAIRAEAKGRGFRVERLEHAERVTHRVPGVIFVVEVTAASSKSARAVGPSTEMARGRVHLVREHPELEGELVSFVPAPGVKSPNRYDAFVYVVTELAELERDTPGARAKHDARAAQDAHERLRESLLEAARGRGVGI